MSKHEIQDIVMSIKSVIKTPLDITEVIVTDKRDYSNTLYVEYLKESRKRFIELIANASTRLTIVNDELHQLELHKQVE